ncbi:putative glycosyl transferase [Lacunisphaera limnophila]|uniref:Putative glycosyl transferase n=1 Tax=Lacunisphaera limnophila TaxID=1838286 RepID=A0A1D8AXW0_9BACT|nr:glycosyltransferase family 4 protein [Lacunisphaera limnophila]AOS45728.1 putative glycosyl transferase [Lacunisphaera limnophila]
MSESLPRVIFVNRVYWPSTEATAQLLTDLAEGLAARGWTVHVIAAGGDSGPRNGVTIHRTGPGEQHGGMVSRAWNFHRFQASARRRLTTLGRPGDLLVVMTDPPLLVTSLAPVAARLGLRLVPWVQDIYPEIAAVHFGRLAGWLLSRSQRRRTAAWLAARTCVTLGEDMRAMLLRQGVPPDRTCLIPNWAPRELDASADRAAIDERRRAWGVADKFVVAYSGNLGRVHEFDTVLAAAEQLRSTPEIILLLIGRGARLEEVARSAAARGLTNLRILPPEPRERLAAALAAPDAHCVTLRPDYGALVYPSKLAGVLAAARPVLYVGPSSGDIARLIRQEGCGAAFAPGDGTGLAATIRRWHADPALPRDLGAAARSVYVRRFTYDSALTQWEQTLRQAGTVA